MQKEELIRIKQEIMLDAIKEFKAFCDQNGIQFFLRGGSVMGAVKYKGFIPWDDDMDIAIPRKQYERLIVLLKEASFSDKYAFISHQARPELHCYFPRIFLSEEERLKRGLPKNANLGLHLVDVLPLDGAPDQTLLRKIYFGKVYLLRFLASLGTVYDEESVNLRSSKHEKLIALAKFFKLDKIFPQLTVYRMLDKLYTRYDWEKQAYAGTITASLFTKEVMPTEIWGQGVEIPFETEYYRVPTQSDRYLKILYGENYLTEEPAEKKSHHK